MGERVAGKGAVSVNGGIQCLGSYVVFSSFPYLTRDVGS